MLAHPPAHPGRDRRVPPRGWALYVCAGALVLCAAAASPVHAMPRPDGPAPHPPVAGSPEQQGLHKRIRAVAVTRAPTLDGSLDDPAWQQARFVADFAQKQPREGAEPTVRTEVALVYDREALYVAARMQARAPGDIQAVMTRRDDTGSAERIIISLDPFRDRRTAYSFAVTAAGVRADWYHPDDAEFDRDHSFDPVWSAATRVSADGWNAELRIPFTQLRFAGGDHQRWGININRYIPQRNEDIYWIVVPQDETGWSSRFGEIEGLAGIRQPLRLELLPYVTGSLGVHSRALVDPLDPFARGHALDGNAGVDLKLGLGPNLTLDATVNPDFGQVEADPAEVNLSAYETVLTERRAFFTEGSQLLQGRGPSYYYSRRIGAAPRTEIDTEAEAGLGAGPEAEIDYVDAPEVTRILGAAKLTGRLPSATSVGALAALTPRTHARTYDADPGDADPGDADPGTEGRLAVEPLTGYGVLRVQQELGRDTSTASVVGASLTAVHRDMNAGEPLADLLVDQAYTGGADWLLRFGHGAYELGGFAGFSHLRGEPAAIEAVARSSVHYFQRPDQDHVSVVPGRRSLSGAAAGLQLYKRHGTWLWGLEGALESPGFDLNGVGLLQSADDVFARAELRYRDVEPGPYLHRSELVVVSQNEWNTGGVRNLAVLAAAGNLVWKNFWSANLEMVLLLPGYSDDATRGGPLTGTGWGQESYLTVSGAPGTRTRWSGAVDVLSHQTGFTGFGVRGELTVQPADRLALTLAPRYRRHANSRQYVDTVPGDNAATYGNRYIFGTIDYRELAVQARLALAFTPSLIVDLYVEPFAASGRYRDIGELPAPRSRELAIYGRDLGTIEAGDEGFAVAVGEERFELSPDFTELSLRSTMVLRWELLPGSTLFVVWQQDRADDQDRALSVTPQRLGDTFTNAGGHTVALKLAYWWPAD